ncbi:PIN domain-containing protein [Microbacterium sp.]|uniref:PIN domain-containing protein n=1 Tax=Microbacterium sp. TaxID=51671 RepID=UPI003C256D9C
MTHQFVDTNILLYAYDPRAGEKHLRARTLVGELGRARRGALSVQVLQEFYVNVVRKIAVPLSPSDARDRIRMLSRWTVHSPLAHDVISGTEISEQHQISLWDAMIVRSASELGCTVLWSEDLNSGQRINGVEIRNPFSDDWTELSG